MYDEKSVKSQELVKDDKPLFFNQSEETILALLTHVSFFTNSTLFEKTNKLSTVDNKKIKKLLKDNKINPRKGLVNCVTMGIEFLKKPDDVSKLIKNGSIADYCNEIADIWSPYPNAKQKVAKNYIKKNLPKSLKLASENFKSIKSTTLPKPSSKYDDFKDLFSEWTKTCISKKKKIKAKLAYANPFLTVSIAGNYAEGTKFQTNAKFASSIEGSWGSWIEKVLFKFNPKLKLIGAGRLDFVLNSFCYDVKSGPRVYNTGQIDEANAKKERIKKLSANSKFGKWVKIKDFQVAIVYGRETLSDAMKNQGNLILFGKDTWKKLTGDEWNSFRFFAWQVRHAIESKSSSWKKIQIEPAMNEFVNSFYDGDSTIMEKIKNDAEYKLILKSLKSN